VNQIKAKLTKLRLFQWALIAATLMFGWVAEIGRDPGSNDWTLRHWVVTGLALWIVWGGFRFRSRLLHRALKALEQDSSNPKALKQWETGHILGLAMAEAVAQWGLVVRMVLGGALWQASLFYAAGLFLLLLALWAPRMPTKPA
jgi:hypothetical protein